jgi:hypothetical protein
VHPVPVLLERQEVVVVAADLCVLPAAPAQREMAVLGAQAAQVLFMS